MWKLPENTDYMKEQNLHGDTLLYANEIYELVKKHGFNQGDLALEIGCAWGVSAIAILTAGQGDLISVDSNEGNHARVEVPAAGYADRWQFNHSTSDEFFKDNQLKYDIVYIDGSHKYPVCESDLINGWDCLKEGGILIADDYRHPHNMDVEKDGTVEYGVSFGICNFIYERQVERISTSKHLFVAYK